jgi:hypothetical protein
VALVVGVEILEKVVATKKELAQSPWVIEPGEISISPAALVLLGVDARGRRDSREELREGLQVVSWQTCEGTLCGPYEMVVSPCSIVQPIRPHHLYWRDAYL